MHKKSVALVGGGAAALMLACQLDTDLFDITIYDKHAALGRKFLVAGDGGFNLTNGELMEQFITRYSPVGFLTSALKSFTNIDLCTWLAKNGITTFEGTSGRVFPTKGIKPIDVLNAFIQVIHSKGIAVLAQQQWHGWADNNALIFKTTTGEEKIISTDITVFALGGSSWAVTGSDGKWTEHFSKKDISIVPFQASNCAFQINWPPAFIAAHEGDAIKNSSLRCGHLEKKGEVVVTKFGLEGGAIYWLSTAIRKQLNEKGTAEIMIDLKPAFTQAEIEQRLTENRKRNSITHHLQTHINLNKTQLDLLKYYCTKEEFLSPKLLAEKIKHLPIIITGLAPIDEAISTVGGIDVAEVDATFQLKKLPNQYAIGEMLDWDAPTGGYLLQAAFSIGAYVAKHLNKKYRVEEV